RGWLDAHVNLERGVGTAASGGRKPLPKLARVEAMLALLGSPQVEYPIVHLTGTNGKTTTARMMTALLDTLGVSVGTYTSPHLQTVNERISHNGEPISDQELDEALRIVALVEPELPEPPSYFDILTGAALRWFADIAVDAALIEVGVGGMYDTTNVVDGAVAVVTNISIDHVEYLGPTRESIAADKAGIVKPGATLVLGETDPDLLGFFAEREPAAILRRDHDFGLRNNLAALNGRMLELYTPNATYSDIFLPLHGAHQADNAAIALAATEAFVGAPLPPEIVAAAFGSVRSPGRLEVVARNPLLLLDGAHNVAGAEALRVALQEEFATDAPRAMVVGFLREKEPHEMLTALGIDDVSLLVCCRPPSPRALDPELVAQAAADLGMPNDAIEVVDSVQEAVGTALLATPEDGQVVVTGSLYTVGAARDILVRR
ncbi:MAG: folylpolyglutamate synthase/dihydrofolate synthase, partial [Actinomycetia bacterium]|nr:folylpolyglutamate synthase/dihydrofolate synthase [Actinomycetes bacterium]